MFKKVFFFFLFWNKLSFPLSCGKSEICSAKFPEQLREEQRQAPVSTEASPLWTQGQGAIRQLEYQLHLEQRVSGLFRRWGPPSCTAALPPAWAGAVAK